MKNYRVIHVLGLILAILLLFGCAEMQRTSAKASAPASTLDRVLLVGELRVGMSGDMPPMNMTTKEDKLIGLDADLAAVMANAMGVRLKLEKIPFDELLPALEVGRIDMIISNMTITPERNL